MLMRMTEPATSPGPDGASRTANGAPLVFRLGGPTELLAAIPFMWGFHPSDSLVVIGLREPPGADPPRLPRSCFGARCDLPAAGYAPDIETLAGYLVGELTKREADLAIVVAYTNDAALATSVVVPVVRELETAGIRVHDAVRADGRRWWSYTCDNPSCCPPDGTPYDLSTNRITADAVFAGRRVYANRAELTAMVATRPQTRRTMLTATDRAENALAELWADAIMSSGEDPEGASGTVVTAGSAVVRDLMRRLVDRGEPVEDDDAATLSVYCSNVLVRDAAWLTMNQRNAHRLVEVWREVTQRAVPPYDVAPATLLGFAAWMAGNTALARVAVERALAGDPGYSLARLMAASLTDGVSPRCWDAVVSAAKQGAGPDRD